jgi:hypothetical protein
MTKQSRDRIFTISPIIAPFNTNSEHIDEGKFNSLQNEITGIPALNKAFSVSTPDWHFGYGTTSHDDIPFFFRPLAILGVDISEYKQPSASGCSPHKVEVHVYDDAIALILIEWSGSPNNIDTDFEAALTADALLLYRKNICGPLAEASAWLNERPVGETLLIAPKRFEVRRPLLEQSEYPMWTARFAIISRQSSRYNAWYKWVQSSVQFEENFGDFGAMVASGNYLFGYDDSAQRQLGEDIIRAVSFSQFTSALLADIQTIMREDLRKLHEKTNARHHNQWIDLVQKRLDHLEFARLQYDRALLGFQGRRIKIVNAIHAAWRTNAEFENAKSWHDVLKERISRIQSLKRTRNIRILSGLVGFIGALSLIEVAISIKSASRPLKDNVPGLLDLAGIFPADTIIYFALALIVAFITARIIVGE